MGTLAQVLLKNHLETVYVLHNCCLDSRKGLTAQTICENIIFYFYWIKFKVAQNFGLLRALQMATLI